MYRRLNERRQITIPPSVLEATGAEEGDLFEIRAKGTHILLMPKRIEEKDYPEDAWGALKQLVQEQVVKGEYTEYRTAAAAKRHLRTLK
ncbi:MAG: AbrB/MazE/SpoVT family DNA-binding domain-containing protein [Deltaproteobacteria bacterium]|nr:AbrB/MazE/SpoVT family DNA-binding domain-containing protein [Deltaproteobacteria bacterium]